MLAAALRVWLHAFGRRRFSSGSGNTIIIYGWGTVVLSAEIFRRLLTPPDCEGRKHLAWVLQWLSVCWHSSLEPLTPVHWHHLLSSGELDTPEPSVLGKKHRMVRYRCRGGLFPGTIWRRIVASVTAIVTHLPEKENVGNLADSISISPVSIVHYPAHCNSHPPGFDHTNLITSRTPNRVNRIPNRCVQSGSVVRSLAPCLLKSYPTRAS